MRLIRCLPIHAVRDAIQKVRGISTHPLRLRVEGISPPVANVLKQEMLSVGGDAAIDERVLDGGIEETDVILMGSHTQVGKLIVKLSDDPQLLPLSRSLQETLDHLDRSDFTIRCRRQTFRLGERTLIMGVLNVTPDSFSDGGLFLEKDKAVAQGLRMVEEGADFIDVGGESTRPGSKPLESQEELRRVLPVIESLAREVDVPISIDTYKSEVAQGAIDAGAQIVNDISGLNFDPHLASVVARADLPLVLMHIRGTPESMQQNVHYGSLFSEVLLSLKESIRRAGSAGLDPEQVIIDPGVGFGKNLNDNLLIIKNLYEFRVLGRPILVGPSRKSFIGRVLGTEARDRLEGTLAAAAVAALHGAHIVRVHDVLQAKRAVAMADAIRSAGDASLSKNGI
jgi:dihydropteroate synthase